MGCILQFSITGNEQNRLYHTTIIISLTLILTISGLLFSTQIAKSDETIQTSINTTSSLENITTTNLTTYTTSNTTLYTVYTQENKDIIIVDKNKTGDYTSIQEAINNAKEMSTIYIKPGTYNETLEINKTINLIGVQNVIINPISEKQNYAIRITASDTKISKLNITNQAPGSYTTGIYICASNTTITDCNIYNTPVGIAIWTSKNIIKNSSFWGCQDEAIALLGSKYTECNYNEITNCKFYSNCDGIELQYSSNNTIKNCTIYENTHTGINVITQSNNQNIIINCTIQNNQQNGIYLSSSNNQIINCNISKNQYGDILTTEDSYNNKTTNNNIYQTQIENAKQTTLSTISTIEIKNYITSIVRFNIPIYL